MSRQVTRQTLLLLLLCRRHRLLRLLSKNFLKSMRTYRPSRRPPQFTLTLFLRCENVAGVHLGPHLVQLLKLEMSTNHLRVGRQKDHGMRSAGNDVVLRVRPTTPSWRVVCLRSNDTKDP